MIDGIRSPPSSSSVFFPVNGQVSAKRSPPLSLVKMTMVLLVEAVVVERLQHAADLRVHGLDHAAIGLLRAAVVVGEARPCTRVRTRPRSPGASQGQCGALKWRLRKNGCAPSRSRRSRLTARSPNSVGQVADLMHRHVVVPEIVVGTAGRVRVVVEPPPRKP